MKNRIVDIPQALLLLAIFLSVFAPAFLTAQQAEIQLNYVPRDVENTNGFNLAYMHTIFECDSSGINRSGYDMVDLMGEGVLRFPGGTLSQFCHLTAGPGYGLDSMEIVANVDSSNRGFFLDVYNSEKNKPCRNLTAFVNFYNYLGNQQREVLFVVNITTGSVAENVDAIRVLLNNNVNVVGVEIGNEPYRDETTYPRASNYVTAGLPYAQAIRRNFPTLRIGWAAAPPLTSNRRVFGATRQTHYRNWNQDIATVKDSSFVDAMVLHLYSSSYYFLTKLRYDTDYDDNNLSTLRNTFFQGADLLQTYTVDSLKRIMNEYDAYFGPDEPLWITEWNFSRPRVIGKYRPRCCFYTQVDQSDQ